jgi:hypothetical protein
VTPAELTVLADVRGYGAAWRFRFTTHARQRMKQRNVRREDVGAALSFAVECRDQRDGSWR